MMTLLKSMLSFYNDLMPSSMHEENVGNMNLYYVILDLCKQNIIDNEFSKHRLMKPNFLMILFSQGGSTIIFKPNIAVYHRGHFLR